MSEQDCNFEKLCELIDRHKFVSFNDFLFYLKSVKDKDVALISFLVSVELTCVPLLLLPLLAVEEIVVLFCFTGITLLPA